MKKPAPSPTPNNDAKPEAGLYIVATPIGNLKDMTFRAVEILQNADLIACEDTRVSAKLCQTYAIDTKKTAYHDHNADEVRPRLLAELKAGKVIALISDAGTPLISDPGYKLVRDCVDAGVKVIPIPGASALTTALCASGLPTEQFMFAGFLPSKSGQRKTFLSGFKTVAATLIFYESPHRLIESLEDICSVLGNREGVIARELTKKFEDIRRGPLTDLIKSYQATDTIRGEIVLLVAPPSSTPQEFSQDDVDGKLKYAVNSLNLSIKDAAAFVADDTGLKKRDLYERALGLFKRDKK